MSGIRYLEEREELSVESVSNSMRCRATLKPTALANAGWRAVYSKCYKYPFASRALLEDAFSLRCTVVLVRLQPHKCLSEKRKSLTENVVGPLPLAAVAATHHSLAVAANGGQRKRPTDRTVYRPPSRFRRLQPMRPKFSEIED